jgi:hypothetical protein
MSTWLTACPDLHLDGHERWASADGSKVVTWFTVRATLSGPLDPPGFTPTNTAIEVAGMDRTEVRDGFVARDSPPTEAESFWEVSWKQAVKPRRGKPAGESVTRFRACDGEGRRHGPA